ncbi:MAG: hypothetical protein R3B93_03010 [Bacteroidia bacterium]
MDDSTNLQIKCPNCGSNRLVYNAETVALTCEHCGYNKDLPKEADQIQERALSESYSLQDMPKGFEVETKVFHCNSCGSETSVGIETVNFNCPFCGSEQVNEAAVDRRVIRPSGVLPFTITRKNALAKFKQWLGKGLFTPNNLTKLASLDAIHGVYLPFWTFDAFTQSYWQAMAGYYYYVSENYRDSDGNVKTRQVRKVRWVPASGHYEHFFDDVLVVASHGVKQGLIQQIEPYDLEKVVNYDSQYLIGWDTEIYQKDLKQGFGVADQIMDGYIRSACASRIPGDTYKNLHVQTRKEGLTFKHLLLPVWLAGYRYKEKIFQFIVNGQTGKVAGKKPVSPWKVAIAVILGLIVIGAIIYFSEGQA